jgi:hypothetical protein
MKAMNTDSRQMRLCSSSILCTERNSATTNNTAGITGKSVNQGGTNHVKVFPSHCTANSVSAAHNAQRNTGRVNRECQAQVGVLVTALSVQHAYHYVKHALHWGYYPVRNLLCFSPLEMSPLHGQSHLAQATGQCLVVLPTAQATGHSS